MAVAEQEGLAAVLAWYRQRLTAARWGNQRPVVVPAAYAGWVLAGPGESADPGGVRPLGAVRAALLAAIDGCGLAADDPRRQAVGAVWGLTEWPERDVARPLVRRIPAQRRRLGPDGQPRELSYERVGQLARAALVELATVDRPHPGADDCRAGPVTHPVTAPWFAAAVADLSRSQVSALIAEGFDWVRLFLTRTGTTRATAALLDELDRFQAYQLGNRVTRRRGGRPPGRSHLRALLSIGLWEVLRPSRVPSHRHRLVLVEPDTPVTAYGVARPPPHFTAVAAVVAQLILGDRSGPVLSQCCDEARRLASSDSASAAVVADLLLGCYSQAGPDNAADILQTAVQLRSDAEDWTALALAQLCYHHHPHSYRTVNALQHAVKVATAHSRWSVAYHMLQQIGSILREGPRFPPDRHPEVETVEFELWTIHQRTGTERRLLHEAGTNIADRWLRETVLRSQRALACLEQALTLNQKVASGDATELWRHTLLVRQAELAIVLADRLTSTDRQGWLRRADRILDQARAMWREFPQLDPTAVAMVKAELSLAISSGEDRHAAELLTHLHQHHRWPVHRTVPEVVDAAAGRPGRQVGPVLQDRIQDVLAHERDTDWTPAVDPTNRRRRAALR